MLTTVLNNFFTLTFICFLLVVFMVPSVFNSHLFVQGLKVFIKQRKFGLAIQYCIFSLMAPVNRTLMMIEDVMFPGLKTIADEYFTQRNKLVFVTGHQRSGTTNVHKAVSSLDGVITGTQFDAVCPSLLLKYLCGPLMSAINTIFFKWVIA